MKKLKIVLLGTMILGGLLLLTGCSTTSESASNERFVTISDEGTFKIVYDRETKVQYAVSNCSSNYGTVTLLVDADGKPLLYQE